MRRGRVEPRNSHSSRDPDIGAPRPTMNPLGRTGGAIRPEGEDAPVPDEIEELLAARRHAEERRSLTSVLMMLLGGILGGVGVGFWIDWSAGLAVFGVMVFVVGILTGVSA